MFTSVSITIKEEEKLAGQNDNHFEFLKKAFAKDGFTVRNFKEDIRLKHLPYVTPKGYMEYQGKVGILAEHTRAFNTVTGEPKRTYYVEGTHFQMGFLLGLMAESTVERMVTEFAENIIFEFFRAGELAQLEDFLLLEKLKDLMVDLIGKATREEIGPDVPAEYRQELEGIYQGCKEVDSSLANETRKKKFMEKLWAINFGHDLLLAHIYTGEVFAGERIPPYVLKIPIMCNGFSLCGDVTAEGKHYFGRDFMFPTADVFQDTACLIIYKPESGGRKTFLPIVSQTAPGIIGSMAAMNSQGVAIGVNMSPSKLCNPARAGLNSLALSRDCMERCPTIEEVVSHMIDAPRGVSWLYPTADGKSGKACIIEAGCNIGDQPFPYFDYLPSHYRENLEGLNIDYINRMREKYGTPAPQKGLMTRWADYNYPTDYITDFNEDMWKLFNTDNRPKFEEFLENILNDIKMLFIPPQSQKALDILSKQVRDSFETVPYDPNRFNKRGYVCNTWKDKVCPGPFYFAPPREAFNNAAIVTNHYITPEMRLTAMNDWVAVVAAGNLNDIQWRYDELNNEIFQAVGRAKDSRNPQLITADTAWKIIKFLTTAPGYHFPSYYNPNGDCWKTRQIHGSVSLFDLKEKKIKSCFGYHGDEPVEITLPNYIEDR
jgi:hypothetical protein